MIKKIYWVLFVTILALGLIGCQSAEPSPTILSVPSETDDHTATSEATQAPKTIDEQFSEALEGATAVGIYLLCQEGDETITFEVNGKVVSMPSMKQIESLQSGGELDALKALLQNWLPSANKAESTDTLDTVYVLFNNGLVLSWYPGDDFGRVDQKTYYLPAAFVEYVNGLCGLIQS